MSDLTVALLALLLGAALGVLVGALATRARSAGRIAGLEAAVERERTIAGERLALVRAEEQRARTVDDLVRPVADTLTALSGQLNEAERARAASDAALLTEVRAAVAASDGVRAETGRLVTALRRSELRGRWGEMQLRRLVETAGMLEHVHFSEQVHTPTDDGALRPDLVVHLSGGATVVVDAKAPIDAYLDAAATDDPAVQAAALRRHAAAVSSHVEALARRAYHRHVEGSPEFVVLFLPAEPLLSAALSADPSLLERAFSRDVVLATPTTLGALLRTVAHGWRQQAVAENARAIHDLGRELHGRLATLGGHLQRLGAGLETAVGRYNDAVGSLESRVLVSARRFGSLGVEGDPMPSLSPVTAVVRVPDAPEWTTERPDVTATVVGEPGEPVMESRAG